MQYLQYKITLHLACSGSFTLVNCTSGTTLASHPCQVGFSLSANSPECLTSSCVQPTTKSIKCCQWSLRGPPLNYSNGAIYLYILFSRTTLTRTGAVLGLSPLFHHVSAGISSPYLLKSVRHKPQTWLSGFPLDALFAFEPATLTGYHTKSGDLDSHCNTLIQTFCNILGLIYQFC